MRSLKELMSLDGRVALITGGAGHIGGAIGEALVELGAMVVLADKDSSGCASRASALTSLGPGRSKPAVVDLTKEAEARELVRATVNDHSRLDILVHCAAFVGTTEFPGWAEPFERQTTEAWDAAMRVNTTAAFALVQEAAPALAVSGHGSVILVSSIYGLVGPDMGLYEGTAMRHPVAYGVSKAGLMQLVRFFATTLAPAVRANAIVPGGVWRGQPEVFHERYKARTPLRRMAVEEDFKGITAYLASDLSSYVTGQSIIVDGGWTAW